MPRPGARNALRSGATVHGMSPVPRPVPAPSTPRGRLVELAAGPLRAAFDPARGMSCTSLRSGAEELLGPLGIPFLHPWANRLSDPLPGADVPRDGHGLPIHGVHPRRWSVEAASATELVARLDFAAEPVFPYPHRVVHVVRLTRSALRVDTTLAATGAAPVPVAFGFHPYFRVARHELVALPARDHLKADERLIPTGGSRAEPAELAPLGDRAFDDGDAVAEGARFAVGGRLELRFLAGYRYAQVYAPPGEDVICFEPMTAPTDALVSGRGLRHAVPGAPVCAAFEVRL